MGVYKYITIRKGEKSIEILKIIHVIFCDEFS